MLTLGKVCDDDDDDIVYRWPPTTL